MIRFDSIRFVVKCGDVVRSVDFFLPRMDAFSSDVWMIQIEAPPTRACVRNLGMTAPPGRSMAMCGSFGHACLRSRRFLHFCSFVRSFGSFVRSSASFGRRDAFNQIKSSFVSIIGRRLPVGVDGERRAFVRSFVRSLGSIARSFFIWAIDRCTFSLSECRFSHGFRETPMPARPYENI